MSPNKVDLSPEKAVRHPFRFVKQFLPRGLFWRSLIIIVTPMILLQGIVSYVFFERDLDTTTRRMARVIAADAAFLVTLEDHNSFAERARLRSLATRTLRYKVEFIPKESIDTPAHRRRSTIDQALDEVIAQQFGGNRDFSTSRSGEFMDIRIEVNDGVLRMLVPRERVTVLAPNIFILWMAGSALILLGIAIMFLRNQVRPIERLARAAESFGKGRAVPDFKPYGASEVRRAAEAFLTMRERIDRHVQQRTEMLAGVSHDLKTPLTRMKLSLAMMPENDDTKMLKRDIVEMEHMLDEYLDFARGEGGEASKLSDLNQILKLAADAAARAKPHGQDRLTLTTSDATMVSVRPVAIRRCITNLIDNGLKYGKHVSAGVVQSEGFAQVVIDDDGPGIAEDRREDAFRPFQRLDEGRNLQTGGVGLGLAIARDVARAHGGDVLLGTSPQGGLRAVLRVPV